MKEGEGMIYDPALDQKKFLIAGGAGFIGEHLCKHFLDRGHAVISWDRTITNENHASNGHKFFKREIRDITQYADCWSDKVDYVLHFASYVSPKDFLRHPDETLSSNSEGTKNLLALAARNNAKFLFSSSARVYRGEDPIGARAVYEQAKRFGEALIATWQRQGFVDARIVRMYNCYGPGARLDDGHVIPTFIVKALRDEDILVLGGGQWQSFTYIDDMIDGIQRVLFSQERLPVDLGDPKAIRVDLLAKTIVRLCNSKSKIDANAIRISDERPPDLERASRLGWVPKVNLEDGLKKTIEDFRRRL